MIALATLIFDFHQVTSAFSTPLTTPTPSLLANRAGTVFDVCERLVPPGAVAVHSFNTGYATKRSLV